LSVSLEAHVEKELLAGEFLPERVEKHE